jgi:hypothetical protein
MFWYFSVFFVFFSNVMFQNGFFVLSNIFIQCCFSWWEKPEFRMIVLIYIKQNFLLGTCGIGTSVSKFCSKLWKFLLDLRRAFNMLTLRRIYMKVEKFLEIITFTDISNVSADVFLVCLISHWLNAIHERYDMDSFLFHTCAEWFKMGGNSFQEGLRVIFFLRSWKSILLGYLTCIF